MATLGEELKEARENKGLTLRQIADRTRISLSFLMALEADDYSSIPGEVFVTGFLRTYARELGIPEKEILAKYRQLNLPPAEPSYSQVKAQHNPKPSLLRIPRGEVVRKMPLPVLIVGGLILGGILTALTIILTSRNQVEPPVVAQSPLQAPSPNPHANTTTTNSFKNGTSFKPATTTVKENTPQPDETKVNSPLMVRITASEKSWYSYGADNGPRHRGVLEKGESIAIVAEEKINLDLGNAGGVKVEFNGKVLKPYGGAGVPIKNIVFSKNIPGEVQSQRNLDNKRESTDNVPVKR